MQKRQAIWLCLVGIEQLSRSRRGSYSLKSNTPNFMPFKKGWMKGDLYAERRLLSFDVKHLW